MALRTNCPANLGCLLLTCVLVGQVEAASIRGSVRDSGGSPLGGSRVTAATLDTTLVLETRTGGDGTFEFSGVAAGSWRVGVSLPGRAYAESLRVVGTLDLVQDFSLGPDVHAG